MVRRRGRARFATGSLLSCVSAIGAAHAAPPPIPPPRRDPPVERRPGDGVLEILPPREAAPPPPFEARPEGAWQNDHAKMRRTLDIALHASHRRLASLGELRPTWGGTGTDALHGLRAAGDVGETASTLRASISLDGLRFGLGAGIAALSGIRIDGAAPTAERRPLSLGNAFGTPIEGFAGYAYGRVDGIRPFVELRGSAALIHVSAGAHESSRRSYTAFGASLGGRAGALVWINEYLFAEIGVGLGFLGSERVMGGLAIGLPIPLANL